MKTKLHYTVVGAALLCTTARLIAQDAASVGKSSSAVDAKQMLATPAAASIQNWNVHLQNTDIVQGDPGFPAKYTGPNSLKNTGEVKETVSVDLMIGFRLWAGAEAHIDGMMWQGFGLSDAHGVAGFPNGEAFRLGNHEPNLNFSRLFIRQTIGLGGDQEDVPDTDLTLAGKRDVSRITITVGRMSAKDIFDNNTYANDPRSQFMNWGLMANEAWDFPADSLGYISGIAVELNQPDWAVRYGMFQMPRVSNGTALDAHFLEAWGMVTELERRFSIQSHPGVIRFLAYLNRAHMGSYSEAASVPDADITLTRQYRSKYGFGLNIEQELAKNVGLFSRLGWSDGRNEAWAFSDVDYSVSVGLNIKGEAWGRPNDTWAVAGLFNGISSSHRKYLAAGGLGVLAGDGALNYSWEKILETYYDFNVWKSVHVSVDYQFVSDPAFNRDRGPASIFAARLHWEF